VNLRRFPGALALGLLASLIVHAVIYGQGHAMGGAYNEVLRPMALAAVGGFAVVIGALAWLAAGRCSDGSVLATRLGAAVPSLGLLSVSAYGWFALAEVVEGNHPVTPFIAAPAISIVVAWLLLFILRAALRLLAAIVVAIFANAFASRTPVWSMRFAPTPVVSTSLHRARRFARPPPSSLICA